MVVEVVGPAGAGKTSVLAELARRSDRMQAIFDFRQPRYAAYLTLHGLLLLPRVLAWHRPGRISSWPEVRRLLRLSASRRIVEREAAKHAIVAVDQGPVYTIATLPEYEPGGLGSDGFDRWWKGLLRDWAATLDVVISLDAPDEVLLARIRTRGKWHAVNAQSDGEARRLLERYRGSFERTLAWLSADGSPKVLRYETGERSLDSIVQEALAALQPGGTAVGGGA